MRSRSFMLLLLFTSMIIITVNAFVRPPFLALSNVIHPPSKKIRQSSNTLIQRHLGSLFNLGGAQDDPQALVKRGMDEFRMANVAESIEYFDQALKIEPRLEPYLWQRGLSLYYVDRYDEGSKQFEVDMDVNGSDVEEVVWRFLCQARTKVGFEGARKKILAVGRDPRPYMRATYYLFKGDSSEADLAKQAQEGGAAEFNSLLYLGLYSEAKNEVDKARNYIQASVNTAYAKGSRDYMVGLARVHLIVRGWKGA